MVAMMDDAIINGEEHPVRDTRKPLIKVVKVRLRSVGRLITPDSVAETPLTAWNQIGSFQCLGSVSGVMRTWGMGTTYVVYENKQTTIGTKHVC